MQGTLAALCLGVVGAIVYVMFAERAAQYGCRAGRRKYRPTLSFASQWVVCWATFSISLAHRC